MKHLIFLITILLFFSPNSMVSAEKQPDDGITVYTTNYPLQYFAQRIAGENATVIFPAPADIDPAFWSPDAKTIKAYQGADIILLNGATYDKWTLKVTLPQFRMVNTSKAFKENYIEINDAVTHSHGTGGDHSHSGTAFTTWLDFGQAVMQAEAIMKALSRKLPDESETFEENFKVLEKDLLALDKEIETIVSKGPGIPLVASHPVYQYLARRYNLNLESVMWEPGEMPSEALWNELQIGLKDHPAKWMIWEGDPNPDSVKKLKDMGVQSIVFDPCGNVPEDGDFLSVMKQNVENLRMVWGD